MYVTATPVKLLPEEKLPPLALHVTPALSLVVAVTESVCVAVSPARFGLIETVIEPDVVTVNFTPLLATPPTVTTTLPVVAALGTGTTMLVALQLVGVPAVPLNFTVLVPCVAPKFVPVIVIDVPTVPDVALRLVMLGAAAVTVKFTPLLAIPPTVTTTFPVVAALGTGTTMLVALQLVGVPAVPLNLTVLVPCVAPKFVPVIVIDVPTVPDVALRFVMLGAAAVTVKVTALLAIPPTVTTTFPVVAALGTGTTILVALQLVGVPAVPLNFTVLEPCVAPKFAPVIVTDAPTDPDVALRLVMLGGGIVTVKFTPLLATPPTVTTTFPVVATAGTGTTILVALQLVGVPAVPLNFTVLEPWVAPKFVPVIVIDVPTAPDVALRFVMLGADAVTVKLTPLLATPPTVTTTFPVVAPPGTETTMLVALQLVGVPAVPLNFTVLEPWVAPKFVPVIVIDDPTAPDVALRLVMLGGGIVTVKFTPLLATPPTVTTTFPVVAPLGTGTAILVALQLVGVPAVPLNWTTLVPWVAPNPAPVIVMEVPTAPEVALRFVISGAEAVTVKLTPLLATPPTVTTTFPVVAAFGTGTTILVPLQLTGVPVVPLNWTALVPCVAPKFVPVMVIEDPTAPDVALSAVMLGADAVTVKFTPLLAIPPTVTTTFPVVAAFGTGTTIPVPLQLTGVPAVPLNWTTLVPWVAPKFVPVMVIDVPTVPDVALRLVMLGVAAVTVKFTPLLAIPPTVTTTFPVVAALGTGTTILVALQPVGVPAVPLNFTVLVPCVAPKFVPVIVIDVPTDPATTLRLDTAGAVGFVDPPLLAEAQPSRSETNARIQQIKNSFPGMGLFIDITRETLRSV